MESKFKQDVLEGRVRIRVSVDVRLSEQRSDGRWQSMVIYSRIAWLFSQVWRSVGDSWVDGNWRSVRDRCWRNAWQTLLTFDLLFPRWETRKKWMEEGKKMLRHCFSTYFWTNTKVFERVSQYSFVRKRLLSDFSVQISHNAP